MHLEGPYLLLISAAPRTRALSGIQTRRNRGHSFALFCVKRWSAAPDLKGAIEFGRYLRSKNNFTCHSPHGCDYEEVIVAFENGYTLATHLSSAMQEGDAQNAFRYAGVIESAYLS